MISLSLRFNNFIGVNQDILRKCIPMIAMQRLYSTFKCQSTNFDTVLAVKG